jgi:enoyl-CoA hydratase
MVLISTRREGDVAVLTLDDGKANTFSRPQLEELDTAVRELAQSDASALVLTGRPGYLSAGLNLKVIPGLPPDELRALLAEFGEAMLRLFLFPKPVVAAVGGHALGVGAMLALCADVRLFASGPFKFGLNEVPAGLFVPTFGIELARAAVSPHLMTPLVVHGRIIDPQEALAFAVAESVHAPEALLPAALARARALGELNGNGYHLTKQYVRGPAAELSRLKVPGELDALAAAFGAKK